MPQSGGGLLRGPEADAGDPSRPGRREMIGRRKLRDMPVGPKPSHHQECCPLLIAPGHSFALTCLKTHTMVGFSAEDSNLFGRSPFPCTRQMVRVSRSTL